MLKELILRNQGRMDGKMIVQRKVLFENWSKSDNQLDVDEMHTHFLLSFYTKPVAISISFAPPQWTCYDV